MALLFKEQTGISVDQEDHTGSYDTYQKPTTRNFVVIKQKVSRLSIESIVKNVELQYFEMVLGGSMLKQIRAKFQLSIVYFGETSHNKYYVNFRKAQ